MASRPARETDYDAAHGVHRTCLEPLAYRPDAHALARLDGELSRLDLRRLRDVCARGSAARRAAQPAVARTAAEAGDLGRHGDRRDAARLGHRRADRWNARRLRRS